MGSMEAKVTMTTTLMGISRSVMGSTSPALRWRDDASESLMPRTMGPMIFSSVHRAATVIAPAPAIRTSPLKVDCTNSEKVSPSSGSRPEEMMGSNTPWEIATPTSMAMDTPTPTRWPTPTRAMEMEKPNMEPPPPMWKKLFREPAATFIAVSRDIPADTKPPTMMTLRPRLFSSAEPWVSPTFSTSAAATPSGYGRSDPVTRARRNGMEYVTPRMPPTATTQAVSQ